MKPIVKNPFLNTAAQLVETVHVVEESLKLLDILLTRGIRDEKPVVPEKLREGRGAEATEVPRGILFHDYTYDNRGQIVKANCIIPTTQNTQSIDDDMRELVPWMIDKGMSKEQMTLTLEMLVRAYDPCISCSVHFLDVEFVGDARASAKARGAKGSARGAREAPGAPRAARHESGTGPTAQHHRPGQCGKRG